MDNLNAKLDKLHKFETVYNKLPSFKVQLEEMNFKIIKMINNLKQGYYRELYALLVEEYNSLLKKKKMNHSPMIWT